MKQTTQITQIIKNDVDELLNHNFIKDLENGKLSIQELQIFAEQYYLISCAFNNFLFYACANINSEKIRLPLLENLFDEHGRGDLKGSHRELLKKFLNAINAKEINNIKPLPSTQANIYGMEALCNNGSILEIIGALGPGCEAFTTEQYKKILNSLKRIYKFSDDDLIFFTEHIKHDPRHTDDIELILDQIINTDKEMNEVIRGAKQAIIFETILWDGIYKELCQYKKHNKS
jgi:pyrroloquinoline quinone (PQQ) biosynthesis protein C